MLNFINSPGIVSMRHVISFFGGKVHLYVCLYCYVIAWNVHPVFAGDLALLCSSLGSKP